MKSIIQLISLFIVNLIALIVADRYIDGFAITPGYANFALAATTLTLINVFIKPILRFILSPIIFLTLGLGVIIVNALILYGLDLALNTLSVSGLIPLFYATLVISLINVFIGFTARKLL